ncbi:tyrosinase family protein [Caballeronia sp. RCC_10]|uniref:tyrosinase family protein n=1 Tax=Caballeronia sp. RCC_10 TaxID=3239227 RepID=UPI003524A6E2
MTTNFRTRRAFLKTSGSAVALMSLPLPAAAATTNRVRLEWQAFRTTPQYTSFLNAIKTMRGVSDVTKPTSWAYWVNVHANYCPHTAPFFFTWHRGYLYYFEQQLRAVSGDMNLTLPYWDYYSYPSIPSDFLDSATGNPLYVAGRVNSNVRSALTMAPFSTTMNNFQRGTSNSYEVSFESAPHNPIHNIIGGWMADLQSPTDPIFYLHHANVDRLFDAWAGLARTNYPAPSNSYWSGTFTYASALTIAKSKTYQPSLLGYQYDNQNLPAALPPSAERGKIIRVQAQLSPIRGRPSIGKFSNTAPRQITANRRSIGGVADVKLNESSVSALVSLMAPDITALQNTVAGIPLGGASTLSSPQAATPQFKFVNIVFDAVAVTSLGKSGGYFYNVYVNLPATGDADASSASQFVGTVGPFEISAASHHGGGSIVMRANEALQRMTSADLKEVVVSLIRVNGASSPDGNVIAVGELRVELSSD